MMAGHVSIPLYPNQQPAYMQEVLQRNESVLLFVGKLDDWDDLKVGVPDQITCISFTFCNNDSCISWSKFTYAQAPITDNIELPAADLCSISIPAGF